MSIELVLCEDKLQVAKKSAEIFADAIRKKPDIVLGLATGSTPVGLYEELIRMYKEEGLDFSQVRSFNLDEYLGLSGDHPQSYRYFMDTQLFNHININKSNTHIPDGMVKDLETHFDNSPRINAEDSPFSRIGFPASQSELMFQLHRFNIPSVRRYKESLPQKEVDVMRKTPYIPMDKSKGFTTVSGKEYEQAINKAGGIDIQLLGIGANGHIGFNEPGSTKDSRTRVIDLNERTIKDNARFFNSIDEVPKKAITLGIATILESKRIVLLAMGENKKEAVAKAFGGPVNSEVPASFLQVHPHCTFILDKAAASAI